MIVHGTTITTNAPPMRSGATTGLLATRGFRVHAAAAPGPRERRLHSRTQPPELRVPR